MDRCTGRHDITEILLKTALNAVQSIINQSLAIPVQEDWEHNVTVFWQAATALTVLWSDSDRN